MLRSYFSAVVALLVSVILVPVAWGDIITPTGLVNGNLFRVVFVTSVGTKADFGDIDYYDGFVHTSAGAGGKGFYYGHDVVWKALVSTPTRDVKLQVPESGAAWYRTDGLKVSEGLVVGDWPGGSETLLNPINLTASGAVLNVKVWTGSGSGLDNSDFKMGSDPVWPLTDGQAAWGLTNPQSGQSWYTYGLDFQVNEYSVYGVSEILTVVPEPGCLALWTLALVGGSGYGIMRRKRRAVSSPL